MRLGDFGFSCPTKGLLGTRVGTPFFRAPEIDMEKEENQYSGIKADIYSTGMTILMSCMGIPPTNEIVKLLQKQNSDLLWKLIEKNRTERLNQNFKILIDSMIAYDPEKRLELEQIAELEWFESTEATEMDLKTFFEGCEEAIKKKKEEDKLKAAETKKETQKAVNCSEDTRATLEFDDKLYSKYVEVMELNIEYSELERYYKNDIEVETPTEEDRIYCVALMLWTIEHMKLSIN
ncbi:hypothetical protein E6Q11_01480 [Candidatus Dojkabacteria bacterium]|uniref:Protein kinase domain-containing protein n=1 Tax=Candidatus Dojkabacteria bacterium TaxID=2099670 RepID=A0A5C7JAK6_9BACT|nr:MAG: hypothetical protein E6Q11_01480 [Candidatus Dojkabacteria bacterium]